MRGVARLGVRGRQPARASATATTATRARSSRASSRAAAMFDARRRAQRQGEPDRPVGVPRRDAAISSCSPRASRSLDSDGSDGGRIGVVLISSCKCWDLVTEFEKQARPNDTRFTVHVRLTGLGDRSQRAATSTGASATRDARTSELRGVRPEVDARAGPVRKSRAMKAVSPWSGRTSRASARSRACGAAVPLVREVLADLDTALAIFLKVDDGRYSFLFESNEGGEHWGRYSFIGIGARAVFRAHGGTVEIRRGDARATHRAGGGPQRRSARPPAPPARRAARPRSCPTCRASRAARSATCRTTGCATSSGCRRRNPDPLGVPDCWFVVPRDRARARSHAPAAHDHPRRRDRARASRPKPRTSAGCACSTRSSAARGSRRRASPRSRAEPGAARAGLERHARALRRDGEALPGVHPRGRHLPGRAVAALHAPAALRAVPIYRQLRVLNPSPYLFFMRCGDHVVLGSSPEIHVRLTDGVIELRPLAGTAPARRDAGRGQARSRSACSPIRRSSPST